VVALAQGGLDLAGQRDTSAGMWIPGLLAVAAGLSLWIGILTPFAAMLVGLLTIGMWSSLVPMAQPNPFASALSVALVAIVSASVALLGPGAFSLDARLFGLREIIIPHRRPVDMPKRIAKDEGNPML
jgi:uncharacterized membrane protein YphA (DoxX/SURF4 family)